jgi:dTDP-4-amino-4,6-dideoxygalactose transaminase
MEFLSRRWSRGNDVEGLERTIERRLGVAHAVAMPMARTAIYYAVSALIKPGQKVVLSPYTIADVINMVICAGGVPTFADLKADDVNLSADEVEKLVDEETGAVLVTHFYGGACDIERISAFCRSRNIPLIEDTAMALGVKVNGRFAGTIGDIGILSFGMYKNVNSFYGGMLITQRDDVAAKVRQSIAQTPLETPERFLKKVLQGLIIDVLTFPLLFRAFTFWLFRWAYLKDFTPITHQFKIDVDPKIKYEMPEEYLHRMTPLQARLILAQLDTIDGSQQGRVRNAQRYHEGLKDLPGLTLPPLRTDGSHGYYYYCIQYAERERLVRYAQTHGRDIMESYHRNCAALPCFGNYQRECPNAAVTANSVIYLPVYPHLPAREISRTVEVIRRFFRENHP